MEKIRVGIIGSGGWASYYGTALQDSRLIKLVAVAGGKRAPDFAQRYSLRYEESVEKLCKAKDIDLVVVATPHGLHAEHTILAAGNGKHVLVEKPMATTVEQCEEMIKAAKGNKVKLMVAHSRRYFPIVKKAKELLEKGEIGKPLMLRQTFCHNARNFGIPPQEKKTYGDWQADPKLSVGFFMGYGCHQLDMTFWLLKTRAKTVFAQFNNYWANTPIENCGMLFILFENGAYTTLWELCSAPKSIKEWPPFPEFHEINEIVGEEGLMILRPYQRLMLRKNGGWQTIIELPTEEADPISVTLRQEVEDLAKAVLNGTEPPVTGEESKHTVEVIVAAYQSSKRKEVIQL